MATFEEFMRTMLGGGPGLRFPDRVRPVPDNGFWSDNPNFGINPPGLPRNPNFGINPPRMPRRDLSPPQFGINPPRVGREPGFGINPPGFYDGPVGGGAGRNWTTVRSGPVERPTPGASWPGMSDPGFNVRDFADRIRGRGDGALRMGPYIGDPLPAATRETTGTGQPTQGKNTSSRYRGR